MRSYALFNHSEIIAVINFAEYFFLIIQIWAAIADTDAHKRTPLDEFFNVR